MKTLSHWFVQSLLIGLSIPIPGSSANTSPPNPPDREARVILLTCKLISLACSKPSGAPTSLRIELKSSPSSTWSWMLWTHGPSASPPTAPWVTQILCPCCPPSMVNLLLFQGSCTNTCLSDAFFLHLSGSLPRNKAALSFSLTIQSKVAPTTI